MCIRLTVRYYEQLSEAKNEREQKQNKSNHRCKIGSWNRFRVDIMFGVVCACVFRFCVFGSLLLLVSNVFGKPLNVCVCIFSNGRYIITHPFIVSIFVNGDHFCHFCFFFSVLMCCCFASFYLFCFKLKKNSFMFVRSFSTRTPADNNSKNNNLMWLNVCCCFFLSVLL